LLALRRLTLRRCGAVRPLAVRPRSRCGLLPAGTGLAFHRARKEKEVWKAEERKALFTDRTGSHT